MEHNSNSNNETEEKNTNEPTGKSGKEAGYPLHKAVVENDAKNLETLLQKGEYDINERDLHGNPPLHLAVHFRNKDIFQLLIKYGADPIYKNGGGFNIIEEAITSLERDMVRLAYKSINHALQKLYKKRLQGIFKALELIPDFYCEIKWEFKSWIPLVSRIAPHDVYKVYKKGTSFRVDTTLVGFEKMRWKRGNVSFLFMGKDTEYAGDIVLMDHDKKKVEYTMESIRETTEEDLEKDVEELIKRTEVHHSEFRTDKVTFSPSKGWFGGEKKEVIAGYQTKLFDFTNIDINITTRFRDAKPTSLDDPTLPKWYWNTPTKDPRGKGFGCLYPSEKLSEKTRSFKGTVWLSDEFPHTVKELLPIFELLAPTHRHFAKLQQFIELKMPDHGFPIKMDLPVVPAISAVVTFLVFEEREISAEKFVIPSDYNKEKLEMDFHMDDEEGLSEQEKTELEEMRLLSNKEKPDDSDL